MLVFKQQRVMTCTLCKYKAVLAPDTRSPTVCPAWIVNPQPRPLSMRPCYKPKASSHYTERASRI
jgi:hypothetical protein